MLTTYLNILVIFSMILVGYALSAKKWFNNVMIDAFSKLVLNIALPLNMYLNMIEKFEHDQFMTLASGIALPAISIVATFILSKVFCVVWKVTPSRRGVFQTMFTASNTIFMGLPVTTAVFGEQAIPYALLYYMCNTTFFFTIGISLIASDKEGASMSWSFDWREVARKLLNPALVGFFVGLVWMLLELPKIKPLIDFSRYMGGLTTPLSLFIIGMIVYQTGWRNINFDKEVIGVLLGRYVVSPLVVYLLGFVIPVPALMLKVFMLQSAMPVQNSMPMLARAYGADDVFATSSLIYSILSYLFVIILYLFIWI
ncbi:AEC family transporter [Vagococcus xieshaowenii]|uniref:AEC family transporter n=1 Tax=Vagococcus xieshaowenii TaxID=2562451 RepID=A0AAJ5EG68_9ENTE|nr:AEC family transporter [Vagococcus xieshaowenii]QCA29409.1 AEC family transporter [Vagococcus xieshaowenii]TFZ41530.1 AEC family transporter [Vagococcus xieshaowenii]